MNSASRLTRPGFWPGRSAVFAKNGMVCASQPLAAQAGLEALKRGGNALDAALATTITQSVVEPHSTGLGGDLFALWWSAREQKPFGLNASGRCPSLLTHRTFARVGQNYIPQRGWKSISVPGAVEGWQRLHQSGGKLPWQELFSTAIHYARAGFPLSEICAAQHAQLPVLLANDAARKIFLPNGKPTGTGEIFVQQELANTLQAIASGGSAVFYKGEIANEILRASREEGGFFEARDLAEHQATFEEPLRGTFQGAEILELPPNGQGFAALLALRIFEQLPLDELRRDWLKFTHAQIEAVKLAYAERDAHLADPATHPAPLAQLLADEFARKAAARIKLDAVSPGGQVLSKGSDTVYICAADAEGNLVSLIQSIFLGFGSGVVAGRTGVLLHNRAHLFSLDENHPNFIKPGKRPFHTIIPGLALKNGQPWLAFGVVGGHHQAQAHMQVLVNLLLHGMTPQEALAAPRFDYRTGRAVALERDVPDELRAGLKALGHSVLENDRGPFGGGQLLRLEHGVMEGASDPRKDGQAAGW